MAITNIEVEHVGNQYIFTWNSTVLEGNVSDIFVEYGPDENYGGLAFGTITASGPPITAETIINESEFTEPFHFRCGVNQFVGDPDVSEDQIFPPASPAAPAEPTVLNIPIGSIADQNNGTLGSQQFGNGNQLFSTRYISPDKFIEDADNF